MFQQKFVTGSGGTGEWPTPWTQSLIMTLPKKGNLQLCQNYGTISLTSHSSKVMLKVILNRLVLSPLSCSFFSFPGSFNCCCVCVYLSYTYSSIETTCPSIPAARFASRLCFTRLFVLIVVVLSGEPRQKQGRWLVDRKLVQAPSNFYCWPSQGGSSVLVLW